ncbi:MAG: hypothetical protein ACUVUR_03670 [bacterium]
MVYKTFVIIDSGGIVNGKLDPGETADLVLVLRNAGSSVGAMSGRLVSQTRFLEIVDELGEFGPAGTGETTSSAVDRFRVRATEPVPIETPLYCRLFLTGTGYNDTLSVPIIVGDSMNLPVGPDSYGYCIYDWTDSCYAEIPEYDWVELRELGERLVLDDDETRSLELPEGFGVWRYYGIPYRHISICANGWIAADTTSRCDFTNVELPYGGAPPNIVAFLWDDLAPSRYGGIWYYYDRTGRRFIVEFDSISYFGMPERWEKVQVQIYDTSVAGLGNDNPIEFHFQTVNDFRSVTVGLQNQDGSAGLTYFWNEHYPRTAARLDFERSLRVQVVRQTGVTERISGRLLESPFSVSPTLFRNQTWITFAEGRTVPEVAVYRADGTLIKRLKPVSSDRGAIIWDGRDASGEMVNGGIYFINVMAAGRTVSKKVVRLP